MLTGINLFLRAVSMLFQVWFSRQIGAAGLGLLQLILTVGTLAMTLGMSGVRTAAMYLCAEEYGLHRLAGVRRALRLCIVWGAACSLIAGGSLWLLSDMLAQRWLQDARAASGLRILALTRPVNCYVCILSGYFTACGKLRQLVCTEVVERFASLGLTALLLLRAGADTERACCAILLGSGRIRHRRRSGRRADRI